MYYHKSSGECYVTPHP